MDILVCLKDAGFSSYRLRKEKIIGEAQIQKIRTGEIASKETLNTICRLNTRSSVDLIEYIPDGAEDK